MSDLRTAAQQALEALEQAHPKPYNEDVRAHVDAINALRAALAQQAEPTAWNGLTDDEIREIVGPWGDAPIKGYTRKLFDQIEAKLKEKNT